jgi:hypothetical protein
VVIWIVISVSQNSNVLLQISDLVVQVNKLLGLLFH